MIKIHAPRLLICNLIHKLIISKQRVSLSVPLLIHRKSTTLSFSNPCLIQAQDTPSPPCHLPLPPLASLTYPSSSCRNFYHPLSTTIICCLFVSYFCHHWCQVSPPPPVFVDWRMGSVALPPVVFLLFAHLPCLPLHFLPHQNGTPSSVDCYFFNCRLLSSSSWCLPPGGILDGMGALSHSLPLAVSPPTQASSACLPISQHVLPLGAGFSA